MSKITIRVASSLLLGLFGFACGITRTLLYLGCIIVMAMVRHDGTVKFFNSLLHGMDVTSIVRVNVPFEEVVQGIAEIFIISWLR